MSSTSVSSTFGYRNLVNIDDRFACADFGPNKVIIMKENGFINATKLCDDVGKNYQEWSNIDYSKKLIKEINATYMFPDNDLSIKNVTNGSSQTNGIYIHPCLIINLASWCNPEYNIACSEIIIKHYARMSN